MPGFSVSSTHQQLVPDEHVEEPAQTTCGVSAGQLDTFSQRITSACAGGSLHEPELHVPLFPQAAPSFAGPQFSQVQQVSHLSSYHKHEYV